MDKKSKIWLVVCIVIIVLAIGITVAVALINRNPKINLNNEQTTELVQTAPDNKENNTTKTTPSEGENVGDMSADELKELLK